VKLLLIAGTKPQQRQPAGDAFEGYQDKIKGKKQGTAARAQGITGLQQTGPVSQVKPRAGMNARTD